MSRSPNRLLGVIFGALYVVIGVLGVNVFLNVVHILIGAGLLIAGLLSAKAARTVNSAVGAVYLVLGLAGLFLIGTAANILALNVADNVLHFGTAAILLAVGLGADKRVSAAP